MAAARNFASSSSGGGVDFGIKLWIRQDRQEGRRSCRLKSRHHPSLPICRHRGHNLGRECKRVFAGLRRHAGDRMRRSPGLRVGGRIPDESTRQARDGKRLAGVEINCARQVDRLYCHVGNELAVIVLNIDPVVFQVLDDDQERRRGLRLGLVDGRDRSDVTTWARTPGDSFAVIAETVASHSVRRNRHTCGETFDRQNGKRLRSDVERLVELLVCREGEYFVLDPLEPQHVIVLRRDEQPVQLHELKLRIGAKGDRRLAEVEAVSYIGNRSIAVAPAGEDEPFRRRCSYLRTSGCGQDPSARHLSASLWRRLVDNDLQVAVRRIGDAQYRLGHNRCNLSVNQDLDAYTNGEEPSFADKPGNAVDLLPIFVPRHCRESRWKPRTGNDPQAIGATADFTVP